MRVGVMIELEVQLSDIRRVFFCFAKSCFNFNNLKAGIGLQGCYELPEREMFRSACNSFAVDRDMSINCRGIETYSPFDLLLALRIHSSIKVLPKLLRHADWVFPKPQLIH